MRCTTPAGGSYQSIKEALYHYMRTGINENIVGRITNCLKPDGTPDDDAIKTYSPEKFEALAQYVLNGEIKEEQLDKMTLEEFKRLAMKKVMDNGFIDPTKAINILQKYQLNCKIACDRLNAHLNMSDYPKFKKIIDSIASISEEFVSISQGEIDQYSDLRLWSHRETALKMLQNEEILPGSFSPKDIAFSKDIVEKTSAIDYANIEKTIATLNGNFVDLYETKFRGLLQLYGATFEESKTEIHKKADGILRIGRK